MSKYLFRTTDAGSLVFALGLGRHVSISHVDGDGHFTRRRIERGAGGHGVQRGGIELRLAARGPDFQGLGADSPVGEDGAGDDRNTLKLAAVVTASEGASRSASFSTGTSF